MKENEVVEDCLGFMKDISPFFSRDLERKWREAFVPLGNKICNLVKTEEDVSEYLNSVLFYIDDLNKFFAKKKGGGRIPYSRLPQFAIKEERISDFFLDKEVRKKLSRKKAGMAGFENSLGNERYQDLSVIFENEVYSLIYSSNVNRFFFSPVVNKVVVQGSNGKIVSYSRYRKERKKKRKKETSPSRQHCQTYASHNTRSSTNGPPQIFKNISRGRISTKKGSDKVSCRSCTHVTAHRTRK